MCLFKTDNLSNIKQLPPHAGSTKCISLLQTIKVNAGVEINKITKKLATTREPSIVRMVNILTKYIDRPLLSRVIYSNIALISNSKDANLFYELEDMSDDELEAYLKNRKLVMPNYDSFSDDSDSKSFVPFPYAGGKQGVNKTAMQNLVSDAFKNKQYKTWIDPFAGAFGATYNILPILLKNGVEEVVINDINKSIINTYRQIQKNPKQVQRHLGAIVVEYYKEFGKFKPETREEARALHNKLEAEFKELEIQRKMSPKRAALFLFLITKATGGMLDYDMDTKTCFFETSYKVIDIDRLINKVEIYHQIFNSIKTTFKSVKYQTIFKKYSQDSNALVLIDPPYIEYSADKETRKGCSHTYGIDFNHKELLNIIKKTEFDFIYYNNHNPLIENFAHKQNYTYFKNNRTYSNSADGRVKAVEITMSNLKTREVNWIEAANNISLNNSNTCKLAS